MIVISLIFGWAIIILGVVSLVVYIYYKVKKKGKKEKKEEVKKIVKKKPIEKEPVKSEDSNTGLIIALIASGIVITILSSAIIYLLVRDDSTDSKKPSSVEETVKEEPKSKSSQSERKKVPQDKIKEVGLDNVIRKQGVLEPEKLDKYIEEELPKETEEELEGGQISYYQSFVTPNDPAVKSLAKGKNYEQIYEKAKQWMWIDDKVLNGEIDKWFKPNYFLTKTPRMLTNPAMGSVASDCESQGYTLTSLLRAAGMPAEDVRAVFGKVDFGTPGGHIWVEVYDKKLGGWFQLEPSCGRSYDEKAKKILESKGLPYDYFQMYNYPSVEKYAMFNDKYFLSFSQNKSNAPKKWSDSDTVKKKKVFKKTEKKEEVKKEEPKEDTKKESTTSKKKIGKCSVDTGKYKLKSTSKYGIFGEDTFDSIVCGYFVKKSEEVWGDMQTNAYLRITGYMDKGLESSILKGIKEGNGVNKKSGSYVNFNLGCYASGKIQGPKIDSASMSKIISSTSSSPVAVILSFEKHPGHGCTCCTLVEKVEVIE